MNVAQAPDWIKDMKSKVELDKAASLKIRAGGLSFLLQLIRQIENLTRLLSSVGNGFDARFSSFELNGAGELTCNIVVSWRRGPSEYGMSNAGLFYRPGDSKIRYQSLRRGETSLALCVPQAGREIAVTIEGQSAPLNAGEAAKAIIKLEMFDASLRRQKNRSFE